MNRPQVNQAVLQADAMVLRRIVTELPRYAYRYANEIELQSGIADVLTKSGITFEREVIAGPRDRFDFLVASGIVIEAKIKGSLSQALAQVDRYAARDDVTAVILVATRFWAFGHGGASTLRGKPVRIVKLTGASF